MSLSEANRQLAFAAGRLAEAKGELELSQVMHTRCLDGMGQVASRAQAAHSKLESADTHYEAGVSQVRLARKIYEETILPRLTASGLIGTGSPKAQAVIEATNTIGVQLGPVLHRIMEDFFKDEGVFTVAQQAVSGLRAAAENAQTKVSQMAGEDALLPQMIDAINESHAAIEAYQGGK